MIKRCTDCGLSLVYWVREGDDGEPVRLETAEGATEGPYGDHVDDEHPGLCCDCFDEGWAGVGAEDFGFERSWPRP